MKRLKISACSANYGRADLFSVVDRLAELGLDGVEITVMYHAVPAETTKPKRSQIRRYVCSKGMEISALHFIFDLGMRMASDDAEERRRIADHMVSVMQLASDLEARVVVLGGGGVRSIPSSLARSEGLKRVLGVIEDAARRSEHLGVVACLEALNRYETNLGFTLAECCDYVEQIGSPLVQVAGDTFHMNIEESSLSDAIEDAGGRLAHLQIPDSHRLAPGDGHIDFRAIFGSLEKTGFDGHVSFEFFSISPEIWHKPTLDACHAEVSRATSYIRQLQAAG